MTSIETSKRPDGYADAVSDQIPLKVRETINKANKAGAWPILLTGGVGCGKTCAAAVQYGCHKYPLWCRADDLLLSMSYGRRDGMLIESGVIWRKERKRDWSDFVRIMKDARPYLLLDDLGVRAPTESMHESLFNVLEWRRGKPLMITSNKSTKQIRQLYDDRIASRIEAGTVIEMGGTDRRAAQGYRIDATGAEAL